MSERGRMGEPARTVLLSIAAVVGTVLLVVVLAAVGGVLEDEGAFGDIGRDGVGRLVIAALLLTAPIIVLVRFLRRRRERGDR